MFLKRIKKLQNQVGFRLTLWHLGLLIISSCCLFFVFYHLYFQSLEDKDRDVLKAKFKEFNAIYHIGGTKALDDYLKSNTEEAFKDTSDFFVRLEGPNHTTLYFNSQATATTFNVKEIEHGLYDLETPEQWFYIKTKRVEDDLEVLSIKISDGEYLQIGKTVDDRDDILERFQETFFEVLFWALILGGVGGFFLSSRALRPIRELISTLKSINKGDETARVPLSHNQDELEELSILFNKMLDHVNKSNQAMRQTLDIVAHELRTPLTSIRGLAEVNLQNKTLTEADYRQFLENCIEGIDEILIEFKMMTDITEVESGLQNLKKDVIDLGTICQDIIDLYEIVAEQKNIQIIFDSSSSLMINVDRKKIRQALANLIDNAIKYSPTDSFINLSFYKQNNLAIILIQDQGIGIPSSELPHIWKRLYRGQNSRSEKGIGLGLSLVKSIIEAHNGIVSVEVNDKIGTTFIIQIPMY